MTVAHRLTVNVLYAVGSRVVGAALGLFTTAIMTRHLGPDAFGVFRSAFAWATLVCMCADLGLNLVCLREISQHGADVRRIIGVALALRLVIGAVCIALTACVAWLIPGTGSGGLSQLAAATAIAVFGNVATRGNEVVTTIFQQSLSQKRAAFADVLGGTATLGFTALTVAVDGGVLGFAAAAAGGLVFTFLASVALAESIVPVRPQFDAALSVRLMKWGAPLFVSDILGMVTVTLDTVLLSVLSVPVQVGYYGVANKIREIAVKLPYLFAALLMPLLTRAASNSGLFRQQLADALLAVWVFAVGAMIGLSCYADVIVALLAGGKYVAAVDIVRLTGPALAAGCMSAVLRHAALALGRSADTLRAIAVSSFAALASMLALIPSGGAAGAAIGVIVGESVYVLRLMRPASPDGFSIMPWGRLALVTVVGIVCGAEVVWLRSGVGLHWGVSMIVLAITYPSLLLLTRTVSIAQLRALAESRSPVR